MHLWREDLLSRTAGCVMQSESESLRTRDADDVNPSSKAGDISVQTVRQKKQVR